MDIKFRVVIFGTGSVASRLLAKILACEHFNVVACVDNATHKQGRLWNGFPVIAPSELSSVEWDGMLLASSFALEIINGLVSSGFDPADMVILSEENTQADLDQFWRKLQLRNHDITLSSHLEFLSVRAWPSVLLLSDEAVNSSHGTGVVLQRFFSDFPENSIFNVFRDVVGVPYIKQNYCASLDGFINGIADELRGALQASKFDPDVLYSTAFNEPDLIILDAMLDAVPADLPVVHHFMDFAPNSVDVFFERFIRILSRGSRRHVIWAYTEGLAAMLRSRLPCPVTVMPVLYQEVPEKKKTFHRSWTVDFRTVMLGNLWQPHSLHLINDIWQRCQVRLPGLRPIDWFVHPLRVQALVDAGHDIGDQVIWRGFVPDVQARLRNADLAILPFNIDAAAENGYCRYALPSRLTELCAAGLPVFALASLDTEPARFISQKGCGRSVSAIDKDTAVESLVEFILDEGARASAGMRAREVAERDFNLGYFRPAFTERLRSIAGFYRETSK